MQEPSAPAPATVPDANIAFPPHQHGAKQCTASGDEGISSPSSPVKGALSAPTAEHAESCESETYNTEPAPKRSKALRPRLFLDVFAGIHSPLSQAMHAIGCDYFSPFDLARHASHDILDDRVLHLLLRLAFSGFVGIVWSAPPCKEFSMLKLRRPGPKTLRTPLHMDGLPSNPPQEQARVDASAAIHARSRMVLRGVLQAAGQAGFEQPPSAMSWYQSDNGDLLREMAAHCTWVASCAHGWDLYKSWAFCASFQEISNIARTCNHPMGSHKSIAGAQSDGVYLSQLTAEYPASLAKQLASCMARYTTSLGFQNCKIVLPQTSHSCCQSPTFQGALAWCRPEQHGRPHALYTGTVASPRPVPAGIGRPPHGQHHEPHPRGAKRSSPLRGSAGRVSKSRTFCVVPKLHEKLVHRHCSRPAFSLGPASGHRTAMPGRRQRTSSHPQTGRSHRDL